MQWNKNLEYLLKFFGYKREFLQFKPITKMQEFEFGRWLYYFESKVEPLFFKLVRNGMLLSILCFVLETIEREIGISPVARPFYWIKTVSTSVATLYTWIGQGVGWIWYGICLFAQFVSQNLWQSIQHTLRDFWDAISGFFQFSNLWNGFFNVAWDFWQMYYFQINSGFILLATICVISIVTIKTWNVLQKQGQ